MGTRMNRICIEFWALEIREAVLGRETRPYDINYFCFCSAKIIK